MALERRTVFVMSLACAVNVANMYYCQPLLSAMGQSLGVADRAIGYLPMWTQAGTALGMFCFVPLGDLLPRRPLIVGVTLASGVAVILMAVAPGLTLVNAAGFATGLTAIVSHLILPFAAKLAEPERRGQVVGTILGGLLLGILLARVVSGYIGDLFGWRAVYWISAAAAVSLAAMIRYALPPDRPDIRIGYAELLGSIVHLARTQPVLRESGITGGMLFGAFSSFWATLVFFLGSPPYHYGPRVAGLFGLVGAVGALAAPRAGRLADRRGAAFTVAASIGVTIVSYFIFLTAGQTMAGLVCGVILMDLGVQAGHVANLTRIYALVPEARSRLNTVYMVTYFIGGAVGSALGGFGWSHWRWRGVCAAGLLQLFVALGTRIHGHFTQVAPATPAAVTV
jgi:predicted MFS family arabinose efflux permease